MRPRVTSMSSPVLLVALIALAIAVPTTVVAQDPSPGSTPPALIPSPAPTDDPSPGPTGEATWLVDPAWSALAVSRGPAAREDATWTVDPDGGSAYLFGGRDGQTVYGDLWRFDLATDTWTRIRADRGPSARFGHSAAWLEGTGLVVFGGQRDTRFLDDVWVYVPDTERWRQLPRRGQAPAARYGSCAVVDTAGRFVISHGFTFNGRFDDTRAYDVERERWVAVAPDGRRPGERCLHECFVDAAGRLVLYGGQDDGSRALGDLWRLGEERWSRLDDPQAAARRLPAAATAGPEVWIFGGAGRDDEVLGDLWRVDRETLRFRRVRASGPNPAARSAANLIADPIRRRLLLFGGRDRRAFDDVWELRSFEPETPVANPSGEPEASPAGG